MNEVEKMYENAGPNRDCNLYKHFTECPMKHTQCEDCENFVYPPFNSEKQIYIIKWLSDKADYIDIHYDQYKGVFIIQTGMGGLYVSNEFEQALASRVNIIWQDLTDVERTQIKEILK